MPAEIATIGMAGPVYVSEKEFYWNIFIKGLPQPKMKKKRRLFSLLPNTVTNIM